MKLLLLLVTDDEFVAVVVVTANPEKSEAFTNKAKDDRHDCEDGQYFATK
jgi:hypothetical protein